ncbi:hypothetical protein [Profundibacter sp.]
MISTHTGAIIAGVLSMALAVNGVKRTVEKVVMDEKAQVEPNTMKGVR